MNDDRDNPKYENLADAAQRQNTNLRRLIGTVGSLITASRDLIRRIQPSDASLAQPASVEDSVSVEPRLTGEPKTPVDPAQPMAVEEPATDTAPDLAPSPSDRDDDVPPGVTQT